MPHDLRLREELVKVDKQVLDSLVLLRSQGVARLALLIQPSLVADANRATVIGTGVGTDLQQHSMLRLRAILADIEVIADVSEPTSLVVAAKMLHRIVLVASGGGAMQHQVLHILRPHKLCGSHHSTFNIQHSTFSHRIRARADSQCCECGYQSLHHRIQDIDPRKFLGIAIHFIHSTIKI